MDNEEWIDTICQTPEKNPVNDIKFPGFPAPEIQINMIGSSGSHALHEVAFLYREIHKYAKEAGLTFDKNTRVMDFGCGFGRILRFFMKDVAPGNLIGTDVYLYFIEICKNIFQDILFDLNDPFPPLHYPDNFFDIIYAYSVFSHLSEEAHLQWLKEFHRLVKPEGLLFLTLRQKQFLLEYNRLRSEPNLSDYNKKMAELFGDLEKLSPDYEMGKFIYSPTGGGGALTDDFYGDTVIPPAYIKKHWSKYFTTIDLFDDPQRLAQALIVLKPI